MLKLGDWILTYLLTFLLFGYLFATHYLYLLLYHLKHFCMKKSLLASIGLLLLLFMGACKKTTTESINGSGETAATEAAAYDFVISATPLCKVLTLTINDCGDGSYKPWKSTGGCTSGTNVFNGLVIGSGNPLLLTQPATFVNIGATYLIFDNSTTAVRDALSITFKPGYTAAHKPTVSYNATTRKFTITNLGNTSFVTVSKFSFSGPIGPGIAEFC